MAVAMQCRGRRCLQMTAVAVVAVVVGLAGAARADDGQSDGFYNPPADLPGQAGDSIREERFRIHLEPAGQAAVWATGARFMYDSYGGNRTAVTGTYFEPDNPWPEKGPRPLIAYAPGTQGMGDQCAPSRVFNQGIHYSGGLDVTFGYEEVFVSTLVYRGFAVVVTDYEGLGTPGMHTFMNREAQGQALLDAARAALRLPGTSLNPHGPVALWGYSQGGAAAASAAELAQSYAPELDIVGVMAGAPPADLVEMLPFADGSILAGGVGYILNGLLAEYPEIARAVHEKLTPAGEEMLASTRRQCVTETVLTYGFRHLQDFFTEDPMQVVREEPFAGVLDRQRIGRLKPNAPVLIDINRFDPLVPWTAANQLGRDWCAQGADVEFHTNEEPPFLNKLGVNHLLALLVDGERDMQWVADRFNGVPTSPNCGEF